MGGEQNMNRAFDDLVDETLKLWKVPGLSVAIIDGKTTTTEVRQNEGHLEHRTDHPA